MILTCEKCATSYAVADDALGTDGRKVKCISCGHVWLQAANDDSDPSDKADKPEQAASAAPPKARGAFLRRVGNVAAVAALLLAVGGIAGYIYVGRAMVVQSWPPAALLYDEFGIGLHDLNLAAIPGVGAGLEYRNVTSEIRTDAFGDTLWIRGEVHNASEIPRSVPSLRASLADSQGAALESWTFSLEVDTLEPGDAATFETSRRAMTDIGAKVVLGVDGPWPGAATAESELTH